jgi:GT2 family glycosyltransferase
MEYIDTHIIAEDRIFSKILASEAGRIMETHPKVAVIILNWNGKEDTAECLGSLRAITYPDYEVLVVDNASSDGSSEYLRERFPDLKIIENKENIGFSAGNNVGIEQALANGAEYVLLLNNDTVVDPIFLNRLVGVAESDASIGIVGPRMYYYTPRDMLYYAGATINWYTGRTKHTGIKKADRGQYNTIKDTDFIAGAAMLVKRKVIDAIGMLPMEYFLQYEDIDYSVNARRHGYRLVYVPDARIWHKISVSTNKIGMNKVYFEARNRFIFLKKYSTRLQYFCSTIYYIFYFGPLTIVHLLLISKNKEVISKFYNGLREGLGYHNRS